MRKGIFIIAIFLMILLNSGCLKEGTGVERIMSVKEFVNFMGNSTMSTDNATKYEYLTLPQADNGDTILIKDKIHNFTYDPAGDITRMLFISDLEHSFPISGDLTNDFAEGDNVEIRFHVFTDVFADPNDPSWTVSVETIKEIWDTTTHSFTIIPSDVVSKA